MKSAQALQDCCFASGGGAERPGAMYLGRKEDPKGPCSHIATSKESGLVLCGSGAELERPFK